jgi:late competence protein required for DNA uptake (superfamily II DNA/RNA helicase)
MFNNVITERGATVTKVEISIVAASHRRIASNDLFN